MLPELGRQTFVEMVRLKGYRVYDAEKLAEILSPSKEHTLSGLVYRSGKWRSYEAEHCLSQGMISLRSGNEPLVITNLRYYNWKLEPAERAYDAATDVVRLPAADRRKRGLVVSITADDFAVGDTVPYLTNRWPR